jgi:hypothetical protein
LISAFQKFKEQARFAKGKSLAAQRRRVKARLGTLHTGKPGDVIEMSNARYTVAPDGRFQRRAA